MRGRLDRNVAFLPDVQIGNGLLWRLTDSIARPITQTLHAMQVNWPQPLPWDKNRGLVIVILHTTHNADIFPGVLAVFRKTGKVPRPMVHRQLMFWWPWLKYLGCVPGDRATAVELLQKGFWIAAAPGGAEEALTGFGSSYRLAWPEERKGFARAARQVAVPILPVFVENGEEMRFNPIFWFCHLLWLGHIYFAIVNARIPYLSQPLKSAGEAFWFCLSGLAIPVPVKVKVKATRRIHIWLIAESSASLETHAFVSDSHWESGAY